MKTLRLSLLLLTFKQYQHIILNENGIPMIAGTDMKLVELILEKIAYGWSLEELPFQHSYFTCMTYIRNLGLLLRPSGKD